MMGRRSFSREFKLEAVRLARERGVSVAQASRDLDLHENILRKWVKDFAVDPVQAFPGQEQMKPEQAEIERLRREVAKLKAERDILKKAAYVCAEHRSAVTRRTRRDVRVRCEAPGDLAGGFPCEALGVLRNGLYVAVHDFSKVGICGSGDNDASHQPS
jgi:transposase